MIGITYLSESNCQADSPRLRVEILAPTLISGGSGSGPSLGIFSNRKKIIKRVKEAGYEGIMVNPPFNLPVKHILRQGLHAQMSYQYLRMGNNKPLSVLIPQWQDAGFESANLFVGNGFEDDDEACRTIEAVLKQSAQFSLPIMIETHRGCVSQDVQRTLMLIKQFPELRLTGDFSHWVVTNAINAERVDDFVKTIEPALARTIYVQARVSSYQQIQVPSVKNTNALGVHQKIWKRIFELFLLNAKLGDVLPFAPEVLPPLFGYGLQSLNKKGQFKEPADRWQEMLYLNQTAVELFGSLDVANDLPLNQEA